MPQATQPNVTLSTAWQAIATGASEVSLQVVNGWSAILFIGSAPPAAGSTDGHIVQSTLNISGLSGETVYARSSTTDRPSTIAITRA